MADVSVQRLADEEATPLPEFTGASSGHSEDDMDDLQFGNVDLHFVMDHAQPIGTRSVAAKQVCVLTSAAPLCLLVCTYADKRIDSSKQDQQTRHFLKNQMTACTWQWCTTYSDTTLCLQECETPMSSNVDLIAALPPPFVKSTFVAHTVIAQAKIQVPKSGLEFA